MTNRNLNYLKSRLEENRLLCPTGGEFLGFLFELKSSDLNIEEINHIAKLVQSNLDRLNKTDKYIFFNDAIEIIEEYFRRRVNEFFPLEDDNESKDYQDRFIEYQKYQRNMFILREKELRKQMNKIGETLDSETFESQILMDQQIYTNDQLKTYKYWKGITDEYNLFVTSDANEKFCRYMAYKEIPKDDHPLVIDLPRIKFNFILNRTIQFNISNFKKGQFAKDLIIINESQKRALPNWFQKNKDPKGKKENENMIDFIMSLKAKTGL
jgi:hypothetical protein